MQAISYVKQFLYKFILYVSTTTVSFSLVQTLQINLLDRCLMYVILKIAVKREADVKEWNM